MSRTRIASGLVLDLTPLRWLLLNSSPQRLGECIAQICRMCDGIERITITRRELLLTISLYEGQNEQDMTLRLRDAVRMFVPVGDGQKEAQGEARDR